MSLKRIDDLFGGRRADTVSALVAALVVALVVGVVIPLWIDSAWVRFVATVAVLAFVTGSTHNSNVAVTRRMRSSRRTRCPT